MNEELKVPIGVREDGTVVHISELTIADNGLKCRCVCPKCGARLQARNAGTVRVHYFAHDTHSDCEGSIESALHLFAKEVFGRHQTVRVPEEMVRVGGENRQVSPALDAPYVSVAVEQRMSDAIPDVILGRAGDKAPLLIEIAVTHFADDEKCDKLARLGYPCIEVDLQDMRVGLEEFDREAIEDLLIAGEGSKTWLFHPQRQGVQDQLLKEIRERREAEEREEREREERKQRAAEHTRRERARILSPEYQKAMAEQTERELPTNTLWVMNRKAFGMSADSETPYYLDWEIPGGYLFKVHRTVWQSILFRTWVFAKQDEARSRFVSVKYALGNLHDTYPYIWEDALFWAWRDDPRAASPAEVVGDYLEMLARCGFLAPDRNRGIPYGWRYTCVTPQFIPMPHKYNSPRYLPREGGVLDTETKLLIRFEQG